MHKYALPIISILLVILAGWLMITLLSLYNSKPLATAPSLSSASQNLTSSSVTSSPPPNTTTTAVEIVDNEIETSVEIK